MKLKIYLLLSNLLLACLGYAQQVVTVSNNPHFPGQYSSLQQAHDALPANSIIYLAPSQANYGNVIFTKPMKVYGSGFFMHENPGINNHAAAGTSIVKSIWFKQGASGSFIEGISFNEGDLAFNDDTARTANIFLDTVSNITISRCRMMQSGQAYSSVFWSNKASNITIKQCYIGGRPSEGAPIRLFAKTWSGVNYDYQNIVLRNNIISTYHFASGAHVNFSTTYPTAYTSNITNLQIAFQYNTFIGDKFVYDVGQQIYSWNNLLTYQTPNITFNNNLFQNPFGATTYVGNYMFPAQFPLNGANNVSSDTSLFAAPNFSGKGNMVRMYGTTGGTRSDAVWQVIPGSFAMTASSTGGEVGAFGGTDPYRLSGIPDYPYPYFVKVPEKASTGGTLQVQIKAKPNN